jgi:hypothetical protein
MKVAIIYRQMFDYDGVNQCIGGIETYLLKLSEVCEEIGWQP